jgi:hypothetical protein
MADDDGWWEDRWQDDGGGITDTERCEGCRVHYVVDELIGIDNADGRTEWLCMDCINGSLAQAANDEEVELSKYKIADLSIVKSS